MLDKVLVFTCPGRADGNEPVAKSGPTHPFSFFFSHPVILLNRLMLSRVVGGLEPIRAALGRKAGYTLGRSPVHHRANTRQKNSTTLTLSPTVNFKLHDSGQYVGARKPTHAQATDSKVRPVSFEAVIVMPFM